MHLRFSTFGLTLNPQKFHTGDVDGNHPLSGKNHHWSTLIGLVDPEERSEVGRVSRHTQTTKQGQGGDLEFLPASFPLEIIVIKSASVLTCSLFGASLVAQMVKNLPAVQETRVPKWSLALLRPPSKRFSLPLSSLLFYLFHPGHSTLIEIILLMIFIIFFLPLHPWIVSFMGVGIFVSLVYGSVPTC